MINITTTTASTGIRFDLSKDNSIKDTKRFANSHAVPFNMLRISWVVPVPPDCQSVESLRVRIESALPVSGARTLPGIGFYSQDCRSTKELVVPDWIILGHEISTEWREGTSNRFLNLLYMISMSMD